MRQSAPSSVLHPSYQIGNPTVDQITSIDKFRVPIGNQEIELQQIESEAGGMSLLRLRIREHSRFTIFDIDAVTAGRWGDLMVAWSKQQLDGATAEQ